jgi:hypothetical protein
MESPDVKYYPKAGYIGGDTWILYESDSIKHFTVAARKRLATLSNEHKGESDFDYEAAEAILIAEGLYTPQPGEKEANDGTS